MTLVPTTAPLAASSRILLQARLTPVQGDRFQPTGFPDLGPATYHLSDGTDMLLVESTQSMANRLEEIAWDRAATAPAALVDGLPYVRVQDPEGSFLTSSRLEAHRLASAYVRESTLDGTPMVDVMRDRLGLVKGKPLDYRRLAQGIFGLDPFALLHGVFFAIKVWPMQPKVARAVSSFVQASDVRPADSGGVKRDDVLHTVTGGPGAEEGYGWVPYHRREFTARAITAYFNVDLAQLRSFQLGEAAEGLLLHLALWEIRSLLDGTLRLRTACDLEATGVTATRPEGFELPSRQELEGEILALIQACEPLFTEPRVAVVTWIGKAHE